MTHGPLQTSRFLGGPPDSAYPVPMGRGKWLIWLAVVALALAAPVAAGPASPGTIDSSATGTQAARRVQPPARTFSLAAAGDLLTEAVVNNRAARDAANAGRGERLDFTGFFDPIGDILQSVDLAICHMEIPIGRRVPATA